MKIQTKVTLDDLMGGLLLMLFTFYHLSLDSSYRMSADDFSCVNYASQGIPGFGYAWNFYLNWEGPFLLMFVHGLLLFTISIGVPAMYMLFVVKSCVVLANYTLLSSISKSLYLNWKISYRVVFSVVFTVALYLISSSKDEIWHWIVGVCYLFPIIFLQLGLASLIRGHILRAAIPLAFVVQSRVTYSIIIFGAIALLAAFNWIRDNPKKREWAVLTALLLIFLVIYLIAPGNYARMSEVEYDFSHLMYQFNKGTRNVLISFNIAKLDRVVLVVLAFFPLKAGNYKKSALMKNWLWLIPGILYLLFVLIHELTFVYITGYHEWERVLSLHSFLFLVMCVAYGSWFGALLQAKAPNVGVPLGYIGVIGLITYLFSGFGNEYRKAKDLRKEYDDRMETILAFQGGKDDTLVIDQIPYDGVLYFEDFSEDPDNWINKEFRKAYNLDFKVAVSAK